MAYTVKTQNDLTKWWFTGTGSAVNRLSELMDDCPLGPAIYYTTGWTAAGSEWYRTQATANDSTDEKIGAGAWSALVLGAGIGALNAGEYFFDVATTALYVRLTGDVAPNATNQVRADYLWDGSGAGPAFMTEVVADKIYKIELPFDVGDASTSTTLTSLDEIIYFNASYFIVTQNATFQCGELNSTESQKGSVIYISGLSRTSKWIIPSTGTSSYFKFYGSWFHSSSAISWDFYDGYIDIRDSRISYEDDYTATDAWNRWTFYLNINDLKIYRTTFARMETVDIYVPADKITAFEKVTFHVVEKITIPAGGTYNLTEVDAKQMDNIVLSYTPGALGPIYFSLIDPLFDVSAVGKVISGSESHTLYEKYTINIHVTDKDGANLSGVTVDLEGSASTDYDTDAWTAGSVTTAANGTITEQTVTVKTWIGTSETLTNYNVFRMTLSKTGYETLTLENITIDSPIDWHLELQAPTVDIGKTLLDIDSGDLIKILTETTCMPL